MQLFILYLKCIFHKHSLADASRPSSSSVEVCSIFIAPLTLYLSMKSEYWEQQVLRVFTCSCHQRKLHQPLLGVTLHIGHRPPGPMKREVMWYYQCWPIRGQGLPDFFCTPRSFYRLLGLGTSDKIRKFFKLVSILRDLLQFLLIGGISGLSIHWILAIYYGYGGRMLGCLMMLLSGVQ